jgi:hypothetical protein
MVAILPMAFPLVIFNGFPTDSLMHSVFGLAISEASQSCLSLSRKLAENTLFLLLNCLIDQCASAFVGSH